MSQANLFAEPLIEGLAYCDKFIAAGEEAALLSRIDSLDLAPFRFQGWEARRLTRSFGWRYDFDDSSFRETEPIPDWLEPLRERAARFAGLDAEALVHALVARYDQGAGIGWHRDRPVFDRVVGLSLCSEAVLRFRQRTADGFRRLALRVRPRSAYLLSGEARFEWEHRILPGEERRYSITFRSLSDIGRRKAVL